MNACDWIVPFVYVFALGWNYSIHQSSLYLLHVFVQFPFIVRARFPIPKNCTGSWIIYLYAGGFQWPIWSTYTVIKRKLWQRTGNCIILSKRMTTGANETPKWCQYTTNKRTFILSFCWFLIVKWLQANCRPIKMNTHRLLWVYSLRATEQGKRNKLRNEQVSMENRKKRKKLSQRYKFQYRNSHHNRNTFTKCFQAFAFYVPLFLHCHRHLLHIQWDLTPWEHFFVC